MHGRQLPHAHLPEDCPAGADILQGIYKHNTILNHQVELASVPATWTLQFTP
jgi:hypothetical protein